MQGEDGTRKTGGIQGRMFPILHSCIFPSLLIGCCLLTFALHAQFTITPMVTNVTCPGGSDGSASVSVSGGTSPYTYHWLNGGQITQAITGLFAGNYSVTITDNSGADSTVAIDVSQPQPILDNPEIHMPACADNGNVIVKITGGTPPYGYAWNSGETTAGIYNIGENKYSVIVTDASNCTVSFSYDITDALCPIIPAPYFTPNNDNINDTWTIQNAEYFSDARIIVFDRWGTRVYEHHGLYEPWNGKSYLGIPVPDAVYYYFFYKDKNEKEKNSKHGSVTIIR